MSRVLRIRTLTSSGCLCDCFRIFFRYETGAGKNSGVNTFSCASRVTSVDVLVNLLIRCIHDERVLPKAIFPRCAIS